MTNVIFREFVKVGIAGLRALRKKPKRKAPG